ncbi:MAG: type II and III secretion system protein family protein [Novosphingobium sp.]|nr:type II and III secretion system protein family protein [Novosphingobium sp.]
MKRRLIFSIAAAAATALPAGIMPTAPALAQTVTSPRSTLDIAIGRGELVTIPGRMADIFVANDGIADVQIKSQRQLYIFGKSGGQTTVYASNAAGDVIWSADIRVGTNIDSVDQMLALAMPNAKIVVSTMSSNTVLLTGTVAAPEDAAEAERLVSAYMGEDTNVISRLKMATPLQVNLRVRFAEVSRSLVRSLGTNLQTVDSTGGFKFGIGQGRGPTSTYVPGSPAGLGVGFTEAPDGGSLVKQNGTGTTFGAFGKLLGLDIAGVLDVAERNGLVTTLSEPNLTALSGETADFLAGGEFPIPMSQGLGSTSIEYKKFGVSLAYTPTVLDNGRISIRVRPEVSELSSQGSVTLNGFQVPALTVRRAETTVELGSGQSFMIAGLMSNNAQNTIDKAPGLGDLPILGNLFSSKEFRKGQTELVIVVTPYLVNPVNDSEIKLPTDGYGSPNVLEQLLGNVESNGKSGATRPMPRALNDGADAGPEVGALDPVDKDRRKSKSKAQRQASAADVEPGFSIK